MKRYDFHIHTEYSYDSRIKGAQLLSKALELEYNEIAITEHVDLLPQELSLYGLPSLKKYSSYVADLQAAYPGIVLHCGVELGDYHLVQDFAYPLIEPFNFFPILGSVHFLADHTNVAIPLSAPLSKAQIRDYYENNLCLVAKCDIDILAHFGVYKRYYTYEPDESYFMPLIKDIFDVMIAKDIALEVNFSSLNKPYGCVIPEPSYIQMYRDQGGSLFSLGSDAHRIEHFGSTLEGIGLLGEHRSPQRRKQ